MFQIKLLGFSSPVKVQELLTTLKTIVFQRVYRLLVASHKKILKRNLADVGMAQCMNALADEVHVHKQKVSCTHGPMPHGHVIQQPSLHQ